MDGLGSAAGESEFMGDSDSAAKFGSEFESTLPFWRFSPDMGKRGWGGEWDGGSR